MVARTGGPFTSARPVLECAAFGLRHGYPHSDASPQPTAAAESGKGVPSMRFTSMTRGMMSSATTRSDRLGRRLAARGRRMATRAAEVAHEAAEVAHDVGEAADLVRPRRRHDHRKAVAIGVAVGVGVAAGAAAYVWWRSQHRDEQPAVLQPEPVRPDLSPATQDSPPSAPPETPVDAPPSDEQTPVDVVSAPGPPAVASSVDTTAQGDGAHAGSRDAGESRRGPASARAQTPPLPGGRGFVPPVARARLPSRPTMPSLLR